MSQKLFLKATLASLLLGGIIQNVSAADTFSCKYGDNTLENSTISAPSSTKVTLDGIDFAAVSSVTQKSLAMVLKSQGCPVFKVNTYGGKESINPLIEVGIDKNQTFYPILDKSIVNGTKTDFTDYVNTYGSLFLSDNLHEALTNMLSVLMKGGWEQYGKDYGRFDVYLLTGDEDPMIKLHVNGTSDVYKNKPTSYYVAWLGLSNVLQQFTSIDGNSRLTVTEANAVSAFITRYDNQSGIHSLPGYLLDTAYNPISVIVNPAGERYISWEKARVDGKDVIKVTMDYMEEGKFISQAGGILKRYYPKTAETVHLSLNFFVSPTQSKISTTTGLGALTVSTSASKPIGGLSISGLNYKSTDVNKIVQWTLAKVPRHSIAYAADLEEKNTDHFGYGEPK